MSNYTRQRSQLSQTGQSRQFGQQRVSMPNNNTPRGYVEQEDGTMVYTRTQSRDKAIEMLSMGRSVKDIAKECSISKSSVYGWMKEPAFEKAVAKRRELIAFDAIENLGTMIDDATETLRLALSDHDNPKLALEILDKMGVLRTTGTKLGMEGKAAEQSAGMTIVINTQGQSDPIDARIIEQTDNNNDNIEYKNVSGDGDEG